MVEKSKPQSSSIIKGDMSVYLSVCLSVCLLPMAGRTAGQIKTKLGIGTPVDPRSALVKVKVIARSAHWPVRADTTPAGGRVLTASNIIT